MKHLSSPASVLFAHSTECGTHTFHILDEGIDPTTKVLVTTYQCHECPWWGALGKDGKVYGKWDGKIPKRRRVKKVKKK